MINLRQITFTIILVVVSSIISLGIVEVFSRILYLQEPFTSRNFSVDPVNQQVSNLAITYDPTIGYIARPGYRDGTNSHGEMGVRLNRALSKDEALPPIVKGGILAVGDSFTFGSEVKDNESWPAYLEQIIGLPVVNAGAGGYGIDQSILRAEQLLDIVQPSVIIVSFIPNCVGRNEYAVNQGLIKPYFDVKEGGLELKNVPVPNYQPSARHIGWLRKIFGYSYTVAWALERVGWSHYWQVNQSEVRKVHDKGAEVSCQLWGRLADLVKGRGIKMIALAQYAGIQVNGHDKSRDTQKVEEILRCANSQDFIVVDSYQELKRRFESDEHSFWRLWVRQPYDKGIWHTGHMSADGNRLMANLLVNPIRKALPN